MWNSTREILPEFPKTPHLPFQPNVQKGDIVAVSDEGIFNSPSLLIEEKLDGANCGAILFDEEFIVRNREHILQKGYIKKETPAKLQFRPLWNWLYDNKKCFEKLNKIFGEPVGVYAEWMWNIHGIIYDNLPSYFIAFEVYLPHEQIPSIEGRNALEKAGFTCAPLISTGPTTHKFLSNIIQQKSAWGSEKMEGIYLKDGGKKYKMLRPDYVQGFKWNSEKIVKQKLRKI